MLFFFFEHSVNSIGKPPPGLTTVSARVVRCEAEDADFRGAGNDGSIRGRDVSFSK